MGGWIGAYLIQLGRIDEALRWLAKACDERALHLVFLGVDPLFDPLRSEPQFAEILGNVGIEES